MSRIPSLLADDPLWLVALKVVALFARGLLTTIFMITWERKVVGRMQRRPGPDRVGPGGWLQSVADAVTLALKEDVRPAAADRVTYVLAPVLVTIPAFVAFSVIPFGGEVSIFGEPTALQLVDLPVGVFVVLACSSVGVYGIGLGGWASGSPYSLFGALRSVAQVISYEIALGLFLAFVGKTLAFLFVVVWLRGTLPRLRYDQFMRLGWKLLVPAGLAWIVVAFGVRMLAGPGGDRGTLMLVGLTVLVVVTAAFLRGGGRRATAVIEPASDYPVPPLDLRVPVAPAGRSPESES